MPTKAALFKGDLDGLGGNFFVSAISVARRQMSRARLASPDNAATFRDTNCIAPGSNAGMPSKRDVTISCKEKKIFFASCLEMNA